MLVLTGIINLMINLVLELISIIFLMAIYTGQDGNNPIFALFHAPVSWDLSDMDMKDQTEAKSTFVVDPLDPFWTVNKNSALSDSQRYNERKFSLRLSSLDEN
jgi:hypothetical protein